ncbi:hypothetical protein HYPSUDRAFT_200925 [Hypholoma sublateritium FD-334 SS-4]|uniref:Uncharacterized protein n=1 Tax=Hypholoma sublateritium (strain FD-334 SS-4) TaxID=945553 RepID=A0A0D2P627_HYPSF|nr:hypothetical protein HYPSUDRAFT_200925 [Hypholoma sublateritium FD-334 SS-4]
MPIVFPSLRRCTALVCNISLAVFRHDLQRSALRNEPSVPSPSRSDSLAFALSKIHVMSISTDASTLTPVLPCMLIHCHYAGRARSAALRTHSTGACADLVWGVLYDIARASLPPLALPETHSASRALGLLPPSRIIALPFQVHFLRPISPKIKGLHAVACNHLSDLGRGRCLSSGIADEHI